MLAGFWPQPIQWIGVALGVVLHARSRPRSAIYGVVYWIDERELPGPALRRRRGRSSCSAIQGFVLALVGEYLGRIQREVEGRPLYTIDRELD